MNEWRTLHVLLPDGTNFYMAFKGDQVQIHKPGWETLSTTARKGSTTDVQIFEDSMYHSDANQASEPGKRKISNKRIVHI